MNNARSPEAAALELRRDPAKVSRAPGRKFNLHARDYQRQYASIYWTRLAALKPHLKQKCMRKWNHAFPNAIFVDNLLDVEGAKEFVVVGTVYLEMRLKPSVLQELADECSIQVPALDTDGKKKYCSSDDQIHLEDYSGRVALVGDCIKHEKLMTGVVAALLGSETRDGMFNVFDICYPGLAPQPERPLPTSGSIAIVSGLEFAQVSGGNAMRLQILADYLLGCIGGEEAAKGAVQITRLIVAGTVISASDDPSAGERKAAMKQADMFFERVTPYLPVDLIPGPGDPTNYTMPQIPIHRALFPKASATGFFNSYTNPCSFNILNKEGAPTFNILGCGGQNLHDMKRYFKDDDEMELTTNMMKWRHIAPSAPDTLACYPYNENDPFQLTESPNLYLVGNCEKYGTELLKENGASVRVVNVPRFSTSGKMVVVDMATLGCHDVTIIKP